MKKTLAILVVLSLALAGMVTSALALEAADVIGTWYLQTVEVSGVAMEAGTMGMQATIDLKDDGSATQEMTGAGVDAATWTLEGDVLTVTSSTNPSDVTSFTMDENGALAAEVGGMKMVFTQTPVEAAEASPAVVATDVAQFDGDWVGAQIATQGIQVPLSMAGQIAIGLTITDGQVQLTFAAAGNEKTFDLTGTLTDGILVVALDASIGLGDSLEITLHEDDTISFPFAATGTDATIICERAEIEE